MSSCNEACISEDHLRLKVITPEGKINNSYSTDKDVSMEAKVSAENKRNKLHTRRLILKTIWNGLALFCLGMMISMKGPSFIDLQLIAGTDVEGGSVFFTAFAFGYMIGSLVGGSLYKRVKSKALLMFFPMIVAALTCAAIPFCDNYVMMVIAHLLEAGFSAVFDTTTNTEEVHRWEGRSDSAMQFLSFAYSFGGIVGPLLVQPFLAPENRSSSLTLPLSPSQDLPILHAYDGSNMQSILTNGTKLESISVMNTTSVANIRSFNSSQPLPNTLIGNELVVIASGLVSPGILEVNFSQGGPSSKEDFSVMQKDATIDDNYRSRIYIPYLIAAALKVLAAMPFFFIYLKTRRKAAMVKKSVEQRGDQQQPKLPIRVYVLLISLLSIFYFSYTAVDDPFTMYLPVFLVQHMWWSKESGALIAAVYWICGTATKLLMVILVRHVNASLVMFMSALGMVLSTALFILSTSLQIHELVWVASSFLAISQSAIFGGAFAWTDSNLLRLDGRVTSCTLCFAALGGMVAPMLIGVSMKELSPMAFPYLMFGQSVILLLLFLIMLLVAKPYVFRHFGPPRGLPTVTVNGTSVVSGREKENDYEDGGEDKNWLAEDGELCLESVNVKSEREPDYLRLHSKNVKREKEVGLLGERLLHNISSGIS